MKSLKRLFTLLFCLAVSVLPCMAEEIDLSRNGSLTITVHTADHTPVPGGTLTIYHVGTIPSVDASVWEATPDFAKANADLSQPQNRNVVRYLVDYAHKNNVSSRTYEVPSNATVSFKDIPLGLYLVEQEEAAPGYEAMAPFLISIPDTADDGTYIYDVSAYPKSDPARETKPTPKPDKPHTSVQNSANMYVGTILVAGTFLFLLLSKKKTTN